MQLPLTLINNRLLIGRHSTISFNRTLRIPEDGKKYDLPAGFGRLPILRVEEVADRVPEKWRKEGGVIIPLYQREALFLEFGGVKWRPTIAKAAVGRISAITGKPHDLLLKLGRQDYVVIPDQQWLDGINAGAGIVKQFVAMPLGQGYTVEAQITDEEIHGGFQLVLFDPRDGKFAEPKVKKWEERSANILSCGGDIQDEIGYGGDIEMGIAAGGSIKQQILEDEYGIETWDPQVLVAMNIHIVNSAVFEKITGRPSLPTPITAEAYAERGIPWFSHYEESRRSVSGPNILQKILSVLQIDEARGKKASPIPYSDLTSGPVIQVKTLTLVERINELRDKVNKTHLEHNFSDCLLHAKILGELLENQSSELTDTSVGVSIKALAVDSFTTAGECSAQLGRLDEAENFANRSLIIHVTDNALALRLRAKVESNKWEDAEEDYKLLRRINSSHPYVNVVKRLIDDRAKSLNQNIEIAFKNAEILFNQARFSEALSHIGDIKSKPSINPEFLFLRAICYIRLKNFKKADLDVRNMRTVDVYEMRKVHLLFSYLNYSLGDYESAVHRYQRAVLHGGTAKEFRFVYGVFPSDLEVFKEVALSNNQIEDNDDAMGLFIGYNNQANAGELPKLRGGFDAIMVEPSLSVSEYFLKVPVLKNLDCYYKATKSGKNSWSIVDVNINDFFPEEELDFRFLN